LLPAGELLKAVAPLLKGEERSPERGPAARQD